MKKSFLTSLLFCIVVSCISNNTEKVNSNKNKEAKHLKVYKEYNGPILKIDDKNDITFKNIIKDYKVATEVASVILRSHFKDSLVESQLPLNSTLLNDSIWIVEGTINKGVTGELYIEIQKKDGKVLYLTRKK